MSRRTVRDDPNRPFVGDSTPPQLEDHRPRYRPRTFVALEFRPFRWYMGAMIWWNAAMSMQLLVRGYLAYQLTDSFTSLGIVSLGVGIPMLMLAPLGGVIADRTSRRTVTQIGQSISVGIAITVAVLLFAHQLEFWHLVISSIAHGTMVALVMPSRQAFLPDVVGTPRLMNAIPLQTAGMNVMQILAPVLGGFMIDWIGPAWVYTSIVGMTAMSVLMLFFVKSLSPEELDLIHLSAPTNARDPDCAPSPRTSGFARESTALGDLSGGFAYLLRDRTILSILSFSFIVSALGMPIRLLLPGYVGAVFSDQGSTLGLLQTGMGIGALLGALGLASLRVRRRRGLLLAGSSVLLGVALIGFSLTSIIWLAWLGLLIVGIASTGRTTMSQLLIQEYVEEDYRGRVTSIFMIQASMMTLGAFVVSIYMESVGPEFAIGSVGALLILATIMYLILVPSLRRVA
jgi:MFS family permease